MSHKLLYIDETLQQIAIIFKYASLLLEPKATTKKQKIKKRVLFMCNMSCLNWDLTGAIYYLVHGIMTGINFLELSFIVPCIVLSVMANLKSLYLMLNEQLVEKLIENMRYLEIMEQNDEKDDYKEIIVAKGRRFLHFIIKSQKIVYVVVVVTFSSSPLIQMLITYLKTNEVKLILPLPITYPFDTTIIRYWPFAYIHITCSECIAAFYICSADFLLYIGCSYIKIQFQLLQYAFENLIPDLGNSTVMLPGDKVFINKLRNLIKRHQIIISSANILEAIFTKSILLNFMSSSALICLAGFNVTTLNEVFDTISFLVFLLMCLVQIFFICYFGDMMMQSSLAMSDAVYSSRWYYAHPSIGKTLLLVLTRAQKPCKLTALGFADINLNAFTRVLSTSWSYFCLLNTLFN